MISDKNNPDSFNFKKTIQLYSKQWKWFFVCLILALGLAFLYLRYTIPQFAAYAKIMILEESDGSASGANAFKDLSFFAEQEEAGIEDEILVFTSRIFMQDIVKKLNLNIQVFNRGRVNESELYKSAPINFNFIATDSIINATNFNFYIDIISETNFSYRVFEDDEPKKVAFGENIETLYGGLVITPKLDIKKIIGSTLRIKITPVLDVASSLRKRISISPVSRSSKVLSLYFKDPVPQKTIDVLNTLIETYDTSTKEKKNIISKNTVNFIDKRVELIASDLINVDDSIVRFKTGNKVTDVASEAGQFLSSSAQNEQQLDQVRTQLMQLNYMDSALGDDSSFNSIPSNLGLGDGSISALSSQYNELLRTRDAKLKSAGAKNPVVLQLDATLKGIRQNLSNSIQNSKQSLSIQINSLQGQAQRINSKIFSVPGQQSKLRSIERKQGIKESLYLYLLQKREEAAISLTATSPNLKIIDEAYGLGFPVFPDKKIVYLGAFFIGLLIPFSVIYVKDLLDNKIHNKEDLESEVRNITVLGEVPRIRTKDKSLVERNDRSILSESFRIIRTNFDYVMRGRKIKNYSNVIFVTSTINGEGKSFFSMNMALTMANTNKRVLLIGADIRNPQIFSAIKDKNTKGSKVGLTEYLVDKSILLGETINEFNVNDIKIDVLLSGKVPPNPAELLMGDRVKELFDAVSEQYDYVIVDTAPSMLVTDTLLISQYAGHTIYLTRAGYTEKQILNFAKELHVDKKLNGMMLVVNDVNQSNFGYGAKYGYYGAPKKKGLFKRKG